MNAHDFSDFWQHCPTPAAAAGFFYNAAVSADNPYTSTAVTQPRHLFAAALNTAATSFDTQMATNSADCSVENFVTSQQVGNSNSGAFVSNPFQNPFPNSFFGPNFGLPPASSAFPFTANVNRRQMPSQQPSLSSSTSSTLGLGAPGLLFSSSNLNSLRQPQPQLSLSSTQSNPLASPPQNNNTSIKSTSLLKIDDFLPAASLATAANGHQLFDLNALPPSRNPQHSTILNQIDSHHSHNTTNNLSTHQSQPVSLQNGSNAASINGNQHSVSQMSNQKVSSRNGAPRTALIPMEINVSNDDSGSNVALENTPIASTSNDTTVVQTTKHSNTQNTNNNNVSQQPQVTCQVCYLAASNGLHFGARTCAACAAFFRRSISDQKRYICKRSQRCVIRPGEAQGYRKMCRNCRMKQCLECGMLPENVQNKRHRRDFYFMDTLASVPEQQQQQQQALNSNIHSPTLSGKRKDKPLFPNEMTSNHPSSLKTNKHTSKCESPQISNNSTITSPKLVKLENSTPGSQFLHENLHDVKSFFASPDSGCGDSIGTNNSANLGRNLTDNDTSSPWLFAPLQLQHHLQQQQQLQLQQQQQQQSIITTTQNSLDFIGKIE